MATTDQLDQNFADQAEADLMAALGISDTKKGAKEQGLVDSDGNPEKVRSDLKTMNSEDNDLAGLAEILPEVSGVRKPDGGEHPIVDENEAHAAEDGVDSVTHEREVGSNKDLQIRTSVNANSSGRGLLDGASKHTGLNASGELEGVEHTDFDDYPDSENAIEDDVEDPSKVPKEFVNSTQSISTATRQTHDVKMPMYLPNFKPATGCTNASDFIVRCFVARLRSGITVVKHGRSRWCKSRLRVLQIHPDGRSLSWKPAEGEPTSNKKPPRLDLTTCLEVRHAWSPDPQNPMYTGTPILRQKCEAANAHKSFALIFKNRTVDITGTLAERQ